MSGPLSEFSRVLRKGSLSGQKERAITVAGGPTCTAGRDQSLGRSVKRIGHPRTRLTQFDLSHVCGGTPANFLKYVRRAPLDDDL